MKRTIIIVTLVIAAAGLCLSPYLVGMAADAEFRSVVAQVSEQTGAPIESAYHRGWLASRAETTVDLARVIELKFARADMAAGGALRPFTMVTRHEIMHGPLPFATGRGGAYSLAPAIAAMKNTSTVMLPPSWGGTSVVFTTRSVINLDGSMASSLVIPAFMRALQTGLTVDVQEVKGEVKHSRNLAEMHVAVAAPGARIDSKEGGLAIAGVSLKSDIVNTTNGIPTGRSELAVAHLLASSCGKATGSFGLASLTLTSDLDQNGDVIDYCVNSTIASLHIGTQTFGPGVLSLAVSNVHAASMAELGAAVDDFRQAGADPAAAKFAGLMLAAKLASVLPGMAAHGLRFSLPQCRMASPEGDYSITALATLKPAEDASAFNPLAMLNMLDADIDVRLPASFVEPKLAQAEASGRGAGLFAYLKKSGSEYTMNMTFHDGMLKVNGEQAGLPLGRDRQRKR